MRPSSFIGQGHMGMDEQFPVLERHIADEL